jgi:hypothetical protein
LGIDELLTIAIGIGLASVGLVRRWHGGRSALGATVNRLGTDVSTGVAAAAEEAGRQAGSLAGTAVHITGSIVVGGASLMADGVVSLATVATGPPRHIVSRPAAPGGQPESTAGPGTSQRDKARPTPEKPSGGQPTKRARPTSTPASTGRRSSTTKARRAPKSS